MILWEPKTEAERKLFELYAVEEEAIQDHHGNRSHGDGREIKLGQKLNKRGRMCKEEA